MSSCVILAAGLSNRMGKKKPLLRFNNELTFLEKIVSVYKSWGVEKPVVVVNRDVLFKINQLKSQWLEDCKFVLNQHIGYGRFYSIKLGLQNIMKNLPVFIHNVDNPFVNHCVLQLLFNQLGKGDFAVPVYKGKGGHPVLLSEKVITDIIAEKKHDLNFRDFLKGYSRQEVEVDDETVLVNINTVEEYGMYFRNYKFRCHFS